MTVSYGLILFELGLLFVKAKIILTDMDNFMDVGEVIYQQTGATSWDSSVICPLVQFVPLQFEEWVPADMVQYLKSANMPMLEFRLLFLCYFTSILQAIIPRPFDHSPYDMASRLVTMLVIQQGLQD